ncbi:MAG: hypothetical protein AB9Q22_14310 [Candidatus Reddybacter sp.]
MKTKILKLCTALVSLIIGFAIVHSLNPSREDAHTTQPKPEPFEFKYGVELALECVYGSEPYAVHFSAYQRPDVKVEGVNYQRDFCGKLPGPGATLITLDFMDEGIRERSVALKFIHHDQAIPSSEELSSSPVINESFHNGIPRGLIQSRLDLSKVGFYTLVIEIGEGVVSDNEVVRIPFMVGMDL